jgi:hypothetical protein
MLNMHSTTEARKTTEEKEDGNRDRRDYRDRRDRRDGMQEEGIVVPR